MTRPAFLSRPGVWTRTARTDQSAADYACAIEHNAKRTVWHPAEWVMLALFAGFVASIIFWS
jgi:hypothetical protein